MKTADIHSQLQALISSCIDEGDYDPAEDYIKDPFCRRTMHTASLAINEIDTLRARVAELEAERYTWKKCCKDNHYRMILARRALAVGDSTPLAPIADEIARAANKEDDHAT